MTLNQAIVVSDKYRFVYFETYKVATRSMLDYFVRKPQMAYGAKRYRRKNKKVNLKYFKFGFVRNPWDRVASCYVHKICDPKAKKLLMGDGDKLWYNMSFEEFVDYICKHDNESRIDAHLRSQHTFVDTCDYVGRFETLDKDFAHVIKTLGLPLYPLKKLNTHLVRPWREYYTPELIEKIGQRYAKDIKMFGYTA